MHFKLLLSNTIHSNHVDLRSVQFFCLSNKTPVSVTDLIGGISEILKQAELHVCKEMEVSKSVSLNGF